MWEEHFRDPVHAVQIALERCERFVGWTCSFTIASTHNGCPGRDAAERKGTRIGLEFVRCSQTVDGPPCLCCLAF